MTLDFGFCFVLFSILKIVLIFYETYWELKKSAAFLSLKSLFLEGFRKQELFKLLVFFSMRKDLSSLVDHVEIQLGKKWNVGDHDQNQECVIVKGEVVLVGQADGVQARLSDERQSSVYREQLSRHPHRVQHNEECVPGPFDEVRQMV